MANSPNDTLLPMDWACLSYLLENDGTVPTIAIPARMFKGEIPDGAPDLVDMGLIEHVGDMTSLTLKGRAIARTSAERVA